MTRNDSERDHDWIEPPPESEQRPIPPWHKDPDGKSHRRERPPMNWPTALVGLGTILLVGFVAWLCAGVATEWISQ